jgi:hypothetical protein
MNSNFVSLACYFTLDLFSNVFTVVLDLEWLASFVQLDMLLYL